MTVFDTARSLKILSREAVNAIHEATVRILSHTGMVVKSVHIRSIMADHGCQVRGEVVRIPKSLIQKMISLPVPRMELYTRSGKCITRKKGQGFLSHNFSYVSNILDLETGNQRKCTMNDLVETTRLLDALEEYNAVLPMLVPQEIPQEMAEIRMLEIALGNTDKPLIQGVIGEYDTRCMIDILAAVAGGEAELQAKPLCALLMCPISPLTFPQDVCDAIAVAAKAKIPILACTCPIPGLTSPVTMAGTLTQQNAEIIGFSLIARLINPDVPVIYTARALYPNMSTGLNAHGNINNGLAGACAVELAHFYGMESDVCGLGTSSILTDASCGYEKAMNSLLPVLTDTDWLTGAGSLNNVLTTSYEQIMIDSEILKLLKYAGRDLAFNGDTIAADVIDQVMNGGSFLNHEHTFKYIRSNEVYHYGSGLGNSLTYEEWAATGSKSVRDRARERVKEILNRQKVTYLTDAQSRIINEIVAEAEAKMGERKKRNT
ncbi:trimethylamine methyltransferase family protein [Candidatus Formimonas warabiya]|uniref:Trimethylamine methyltransferase n=1 Tax=Formimonas warabiya TaxID=1761012 RepID=A0A3G1KT30_FORW1|nr:trimethylamine methyltransferase family protein [Candidatus Formimonas warabiya]ATW25609.1 hypothetical protein DCMF_13330 [Candidatus Formimonas warabiya]